MAALLILAVRNNPTMFEKVNPLMETSQTVNLGILPWVVNRPVKRRVPSLGCWAELEKTGGRLHHSLRLDPLHKEVQLQRLKDLLHAGADTRVLGHGQQTILINAMRVNPQLPDFDLMRKRVEAILAVDPGLASMETHNSASALHYALKTEDGYCLSSLFKPLLIAFPGAIEVKDWRGDTPVDIVRKVAWREPHRMQLLEEAIVASQSQ